MPIQITLSDEVAFDIMRQITEGLTKRIPEPQQAEPKLDLYADAVVKVRAIIEEMAPGTTLHVSTLAARQLMPTNAVSNTLQVLKDQGLVKMVRRGTWERVSRVAMSA